MLNFLAKRSPQQSLLQLASFSAARSLLHHLAYEEVTSSGAEKSPEADVRTGVLLHGLLGSARNWRSFAKGLASQASAADGGRPWRLWLLDLRCHGRSSASARGGGGGGGGSSGGSGGGFAPPHTMQSAAADVFHFICHKLGPHRYSGHHPPASSGSHAAGARLHMLAGHSMGGKVALEVLRKWHARQQTDSLAAGGSQHLLLPPPPPHVWVLDSQPGVVATSTDLTTGVSKVLAAVRSAPQPIPSRDWLLSYCRQQGFSNAIAQWLGTSLVPLPPPSSAAASSSSAASTGFTWAFDVAGASALYDDYKATDSFDLLCRPPPGVCVHLVRGERSDRWTPDMDARLQEALDHQQHPSTHRGKFRLHVLPNAGHWVQADNPTGLLKIMIQANRELSVSC